MAFQGRVEKCGAQLIGWALDDADLESAVAVNIKINAEKQLYVICSIHRNDIQNVFGSAEHGFSVDLAPFLEDGLNQVSCVFAATDEPLAASDCSFEYRKPPAKVFHGQDDWLFLHNDSNRVIEQLFGNYTLSHQDEVLLSQEQYLRRLVAEDLGAQHVSIVIPEKHVVYSDKVSKARFISPRRFVFKFKELFEREWGFEMLYPVEPLISAKGLGEVYYRSDSHISSAGTAVVVRMLVSLLGGHNLGDRITFSRSPLQLSGDLGSKLNPAVIEQTEEYKLSDKLLVLSNDVDDRFKFDLPRTGGHCVIRNDAAVLNKTAVIFGTSTTYMHRDLYSSIFRMTLIIWTPSWSFELLRALRPDIILNIYTERILPQRLHDLAARVGGIPEWLREHIVGLWEDR